MEFLRQYSDAIRNPHLSFAGDSRCKKRLRFEFRHMIGGVIRITSEYGTVLNGRVNWLIAAFLGAIGSNRCRSVP